MPPKKPPQHASLVQAQAMGAQCGTCPLKGAGRAILGRGADKALLAFVGDCPGRAEEQAGIPFMGAPGQLLEKHLGELNLSRTTVWLDQAVACFPPGGDFGTFLKVSKKEYKAAKLPWRNPVDCCRPRLFRALRVPRCQQCSRWLSGPATVDGEPFTCRCLVPVPKHWLGPSGKIEAPINYVALLGGTALESCMGVHGITAWRGSPNNMERRRQKAAGHYKEPWQ